LKGDGTVKEVNRLFSGAPWEKTVGYCRAIKVQNSIYISGTAPIGANGKTAHPGNPYLQAKRCFEIIEETLKKFDTSIQSVIRTRMYVTDITLWEEFGRAHKEVFGEHPPVTTMVEVSSLIDSDMLIEVEADAISSS
jgi:enamine deaminase RidA (YjgF/YER057c/UK114 family)